MALQLNVSEEFRSLTDAMIKSIENKLVRFENLNFLLCKVPLKENSSIMTSAGYKRIESYHSGVGRVIARPRTLNSETDASPEVGDYVFYSHESKYTVSEPVTNFLLDVNMNYEEGKEPIVCIRDVDIISIFTQSIVHQDNNAPRT